MVSGNRGHTRRRSLGWAGASGTSTSRTETSLPHIPGHEPAGAIVAVGKDVVGLRPGQRVVPHLFVADADCPYTRTGEHAQAMHLRGILGVTMPGGFEEPEFPAVDTISIAQRELRLIGSRNGGLQDARDALELMASGVIRPVIAARYPLDQINLALLAVRNDEVRGRAVVTVKD
jgi:D-arabinose 1-dehydrogenase-like Zn-dependent alcohol dehydrogenase